jgi:acyl carrier protein phosphodiesterase
MNYLAHLFLAQPNDEHRIGSLLADFQMGTIDMICTRYSKTIAHGVFIHRKIDQYTDNHPSVIECTDSMNNYFGVYSGIVADVMFDHFLLLHWEEYSETDQDYFFNDIYTSLSRMEWEFPPRYKEVVCRLLQKKWLASYIELDTVAFALSKIALRFPRKTPLSDAMPGISANYSLLEKKFLEFFPMLFTFAQNENSLLID